MLGRTSKLLFSDAALGGFVTLLCLIAYFGNWPLLRSIEAWTYDVRVPLRANPKPSDPITALLWIMTRLPMSEFARIATPE